MSSPKALPRYLNHLPLQRLGDARPAGLLLASVPIPRNAPQNWSLDGRPTFAKPLGKWCDAESPRRLLLVADNAGNAPEQVPLSKGTAETGGTVPSAIMETFEHAPAEDLPLFYWERSLLRITWRGKSLGIAMGLRVKGELHWWEACNFVVKSRTTTCLEVEMGGTIPYEVTTAETFKQFEGKDNPYVHKHNWVNGHLYARLHSNGVCEVYAHHINSMFDDDGADFKDTVPVIAFQIDGGEKSLGGISPVWDGTRRELRLGGIDFDLTDVARLATIQKPGRLEAANGFIVLQPYQGAEFCGGPLTEIRIGDEYLWRSEQEIWPRGMARTLRFSLSLNPKRSPRVARYLAPPWWYGLCEEYQPRPILPVSNEHDESIHTARRWYHENMRSEGFEEGVTPQSGDKNPAAGNTPAGEGDIPAGMFLTAYRTGDAMDYDCAMRATYCMIDVFVDHATKRTRFPGHHAGATALPLQRMHGAIMGWLETGDPYLLNTAEAVTDNAYWWHKNSWPRRAIGRDARFVHTQMMLYRYLGDRHYLERTREMIADLAAAQWPDGSFGDQGGGSGIHGYAAYIIKPWMGCLATFGILDYLEHFPDDEPANEVVRKFVQWLMTERGPRLKDRDHPEKGKVMGWTYQHDFKGKPIPGKTMPKGPTPDKYFLHWDYMARLMTWYSMKTGSPKYYDAYVDSNEGEGFVRHAAYHRGTSVLMCIPWLQDRLWSATVTKNGIAVQALYLGARTPKTGRIIAPDGVKELTWLAPGKLKVPKGVRAKIIRLRGTNKP
jgi:hypothetical protein